MLKTDFRIRQIIDILKDYPDGIASIKELAEQLDISYTYLYKLAAKSPHILIKGGNISVSPSMKEFVAIGTTPINQDPFLGTGLRCESGFLERANQFVASLDFNSEILIQEIQIHEDGTGIHRVVQLLAAILLSNSAVKITISRIPLLEDAD